MFDHVVLESCLGDRVEKVCISSYVWNGEQVFHMYIYIYVPVFALPLANLSIPL